MARQRRFILPGRPHLVVQRGHNGQRVAHDAVDQQTWIAVLRDVAATRRVVLHAWSLTGREFRLLATPPDEASLGRLVQDLGRRYVARFNLRHQRSGTLWDGRYRCTAVLGTTLELMALAYVEREAAEPETAASSRAHHLGERVDAGISDLAAYWSLGNTPFERQDGWRRCLAQDPGAADTACVERALRSGIPLAPAEVLQELQPQTSNVLFPRPRGRPRKACAAEAAPGAPASAPLNR
ncbi:MAG: transposase [Rubrivivax sp.]|nr:transposase [Rubrivivax sp.]